jgi:hypothetical protein
MTQPSAVFILVYLAAFLQLQPVCAQKPVSEYLPIALQQCIDIALERSQWRPLSQLEVEIARAQHQQALSSYWPQAGSRQR